MLKKLFVLIVVVAGSSSLPEIALATNRAGMSREEIRSMDILERPNRPGHFYGNTVRRANQRRGG